ncbi:DUF3472 domain-containing protein [Burkholderia sp. JSH-S8]|nr:DUF3472 domain-containing protein [Burkholderia sp. JSH-S8]WGS46956.1 DUF3472 domain-containing protein [Burkholderia sp. JSH-S8]
MKNSVNVMLRALVCAGMLVTFAAWGLTTTPSGAFVLSKGNNSNIDFSFNVQSDPGDKSYVFWAQQFWFETGPGGYLGLQRVGGAKKIIFSIWNATSSTALMQGAVAESFSGEGTGQHVIAPFDWQSGRNYKFRLENAGGSWWEVSVTDLTTSAHWRLGKIQAQPRWGKLRKNVSTFTEVFINGNSCEEIPYARATFGAPSSDNGAGKTTQIIADTYGNFTPPCALMRVAGAKDGVNFGTRSDKIGSTLVHQIGLSNGPQKWGDFDRRGRVGTIFSRQNPTTYTTEYFMLKALGADGRYWYFPDNRSDNYFWSYLGTKEPFYNKNPIMALSDQISQQGNLNKLDAGGTFINSVLFKSPLKSTQITTSDGSWVSAINLPRATVEGAVVQAAIRSTWPVSVVVNNMSFPIENGTTKNFTYIAGEWDDSLPNATLSSQGELNRLDGAGVYLRNSLQQNNYVHVVTSDGNWIGQISLPPNASDGAKIRVSVQSSYGVTVAYGSGSESLVTGRSKVYKYLRNAWTPCQTPLSCQK